MISIYPIVIVGIQLHFAQFVQFSLFIIMLLLLYFIKNRK